MTPLFYIAFGATIFFTLALAIFLFFTRTSRAALQRIREITYNSQRYRRSSTLANNAGRRFMRVVRWMQARLGLAADEIMPERLANAGFKGTLSADIYSTSRILLPVLGLLAGCLIAYDREFWMIALPAAAFIAPNIALTRLIKRRREKIRRSIPDVVDLMVICVDAGLGIDQALLRVGQELGHCYPQITEELLQINREQRAGKPRIQAWSDMALRSELPEIDSFASMLVQTERFGTPISHALSALGDNIRLKRRQMAEEKAAKTTVKIIFPLVLCIFPSMFLVLLGPAILGILRGTGFMGQ
jgi:tight adherence protein C